MNVIAIITAILSFILCAYASAFMSTSGDKRKRKKGWLISLISIAVIVLSGSYLIYY